MSGINIEDMSESELNDLSSDISFELGRRDALPYALSEMRRVVNAYRAFIPHVAGGEWVRPDNPVVSYLSGDIVTHADVQWVSQRDFNYLEPGEDAAAWSPQSEF